jgi:hypothetical protein
MEKGQMKYGSIWFGCMQPEGPCAGGLVLRLWCWKIGWIFKRWGLVGGPKITGVAVLRRKYGLVSSHERELLQKPEADP